MHRGEGCTEARGAQRRGVHRGEGCTEARGAQRRGVFGDNLMPPYKASRPVYYANGRLVNRCDLNKYLF